MKHFKYLLFFISFLGIIPYLLISSDVHAENITLTPRQKCDLEMIFIGAFSPLDSFLNKKDYESVVVNMRLTNGKIWPIPIILDVSQEIKNKIKLSSTIRLLDEDGTHLASLFVEEIWAPDKTQEAKCVFGTTDKEHPGVKYLMEKVGKYYVSGRLIKGAGFNVISGSFPDFKKTPQELKMYFKKNDISTILAFQTRNPMHRAHVALVQEAMKRSGCQHLLLHPVIGVTKPGDIDPYTRVRCYKKILNHLEVPVTLNVLPLAMRMAGPREALWHALIRKNYGATHFVVGRDHAGPGKNSKGISFYDDYAAHDLLKKYSKEIEIKPIFIREMVYVPH